jgi:hypothetical protein
LSEVPLSARQAELAAKLIANLAASIFELNLTESRVQTDDVLETTGRAFQKIRREA